MLKKLALGPMFVNSVEATASKTSSAAYLDNSAFSALELSRDDNESEQKWIRERERDRVPRRNAIVAQMTPLLSLPLSFHPRLAGCKKHPSTAIDSQPLLAVG